MWRGTIWWGFSAKAPPRNGFAGSIMAQSVRPKLRRRGFRQEMDRDGAGFLRPLDGDLRVEIGAAAGEEGQNVAGREQPSGRLHLGEIGDGQTDDRPLD